MNGVPRGLAAHTKGLTCGDCRCARWPRAVALALDRARSTAGASVRGGCARRLLSMDWGRRPFLGGAVRSSAGCCVARTLRRAAAVACRGLRATKTEIFISLFVIV